MKAGPTIAVVGANGFIGKHLTQHFEVLQFAYCGVTRQDPILDGHGGLNLNLRMKPLQTVYWLASSSIPLVVEQDPSVITREDDYFKNSLKELQRHHQQLRVVLLSSASVVYADSAHACVESSPLEPFNQYGRLKIALENTLKDSGIDFMIFRVTNAYGPGQRCGRGQGVIAEWLGAARAQKPLVLIGDEDTVRDYVHVTDVVNAMYLARTQWSSGEVLNIGSESPISLGGLLTIVRAVIGENIHIQRLESRVFDRKFVSVSIAKAESLLGWEPQIGLQQGIEDWWENYP